MKLINNIECYNSGWTILFFQSENVDVSKAALGAVAGGDVETGKVTVDDGCADADVEAVLFGVKAFYSSIFIADAEDEGTAT